MEIEITIVYYILVLFLLSYFERVFDHMVNKSNISLLSTLCSLYSYDGVGLFLIRNETQRVSEPHFLDGRWNVNCSDSEKYPDSVLLVRSRSCNSFWTFSPAWSSLVGLGQGIEYFSRYSDKIFGSDEYTDVNDTSIFKWISILLCSIVILHVEKINIDKNTNLNGEFISVSQPSSHNWTLKIKMATFKRTDIGMKHD